VRKFLAFQTVKGGAEWKGEYLGKVARWYYAKGEVGYIQYKSNGNKVPLTDGAKPLMTLPDTIPSDLDYDWYINRAKHYLELVGYPKRDM
jgi:hypothetical protein